jgi:hypothetical protein
MLGLRNSVFFPATSSVLQAEVDIKALCSAVNYQVCRPSLKDCLTLKDGTDGLFRNAGNQLPIYAA